MRELLYQPPQRERWLELLEMFEGWPHEDGFSVALEYANNHLSSWPDATRVAPRAWVERLLEGKRPHRAWPLVRHISMRSCGLGPEDAFCLARHSAMSCVTHLELSYNHLQSEGARYLARSPHLGSLRLLWLGSNKTGEGTLAQLCGSASGFALTSLNLSGGHFCDEDLEALLGSSLLDSLEHLNLGASDSHHRERPAPALWRRLCARGAPRLRSLWLSGHSLGKEEVTALAQCSTIPALEELSLAYVRNLSSDAVFTLLGSEGLPRLRTLRLNGVYPRFDHNTVVAMRSVMRQRAPGGVLHI
jgi:hypothetical protein